MGEISERREGRKRRDRGEAEEEGRVCDEREKWEERRKKWWKDNSKESREIGERIERGE